jgi:hypothetical protein
MFPRCENHFKKYCTKEKIMAKTIKFPADENTKGKDLFLNGNRFKNLKGVN